MAFSGYLSLCRDLPPLRTLLSPPPPALITEALLLWTLNTMGDVPGAIHRISQDLLPLKPRALLGVGQEGVRKKPPPCSLRPPPSAPGLLLGHAHRSVLFVFRAWICSSFYPWPPHLPLWEWHWFSFCRRAPWKIWCIIVSLLLFPQRLNTAVPRNIDPVIWFTNTALAWRCFLASVPIKRHIFRIKPTHYSFFTIPLLQLMPAACIINDTWLIFASLILWYNHPYTIISGLCYLWDIGISPYVLNQWDYYFS